MKTICSVFFAAALGLATAASAQALQDPTRPPASIAAARNGAPIAQVAIEGPRLQSILIAPTSGGRHVAVIDGQTVRPGENFKGARVEHMTATEVVLSKNGRRQILKLFPATAAGPNAQPVQR
jgi:MSHA biogenesis protein MshK